MPKNNSTINKTNTFKSIVEVLHNSAYVNNKIARKKRSINDRRSPKKIHSEEIIKTNNTNDKTYTRIYQDCNEPKPNQATEVDDLNIPVPRSRYSRIVVPDNNYTFKQLPTIIKNKRPNNTTTKEENEKSKKKISTIYNLANIPYVEVPDYTDERELSLDQEDRRRITERYRSDDAVDPGTPSIVVEEKGISDKISSKSESNHDNENVDRKAKNNPEVNLENQQNNNTTNNSVNAQINKKKITQLIFTDYAPTINSDEFRKPFDLDKFIADMFHQSARRSNFFVDSSEDITETTTTTTSTDRTKSDDNAFIEPTENEYTPLDFDQKWKNYFSKDIEDKIEEKNEEPVTYNGKINFHNAKNDDLNKQSTNLFK